MDESQSETGNSSEGPNREKLTRLESFVGGGVDHLQRNDWERAIRYFENNEMAQALGFQYEEGTSFGLRKTPSPDKLKGIADFVAAHSWFRTYPGNIPTVVLSGVFSMPVSQGEIVIPEDLKHDVALIHAEEWLHSFQYVKGNSLAGSTDGEVDVALYLKAQGISLTDNFLARHGRKSVVKY